MIGLGLKVIMLVNKLSLRIILCAISSPVYPAVLCDNISALFNLTSV
ncbi:MAG: hypothetical protein ACKESC_00250 [Candidatus Hodgkinia cicadicola]